MDNGLIFPSLLIFVLSWGMTMYGIFGLAVKLQDLSV